MSNKINIPIGIEFGKRDTDATKMSSEEIENYKNKPNVVIENNEYENPTKITELFFKINKIDNISLIEFVYGKNSKKQEEDILEEELKNELNKYILEKLEKHNDLDDYPIFDYIKNGVIGKLMGNFDKELLFKKAFQNTNNKYPEKIVFQGGKRIYNKDDIKRKENACEISTTKEIKNHLDLLLHRIIYFYYKYMHTIQEPDTDDALKKSAPFNYRIKLIQSINETLFSFTKSNDFLLMVNGDVVKRSNIFKEGDKKYLEYKYKDIDYSIFDDVLFYLLDSKQVKENMWFKLLELNHYILNIKDSNKDKDRKIVSNTFFFNFFKDYNTEKFNKEHFGKGREDKIIRAPDQIDIKTDFLDTDVSNIKGIKPFDLLDCYELFLFKQILFEFKVYLDDPEYCSFKIEISKEDNNAAKKSLDNKVKEVNNDTEISPTSALTHELVKVYLNRKGGANPKDSILNDNMLGMDLWDTPFPEIDVFVVTDTEKQQEHKKLVHTQFLFMVKYYNILAILYEKIIQKVPNEIIYGKNQR
jgi:hypothetical protein